MHYIADYGLFLAKIITFVIAFLVVVAGTLSLILKNKGEPKGQLQIKKLNEKYENMQDELSQIILDKKSYKSFKKEMKKLHKDEEKADLHKRRIFVLKFMGDIRATAVEQLREEITAVLSIATTRDEVVLCLDSGGGLVHGYGLAASQLQRIREKEIPLTIIIDKVAASGGYLMACVANKILAAPFAIIGSIGVLAQIPNFHRLLKDKNIDFEQISAGEYKRTLTLFGENTEKGREKLKSELEEIHFYFKSFISKNREIVDVEKIATGEHWVASKALELKLIDGLSTSDDYLLSLSKTADIFDIAFQTKKSLTEKLSHFMHHKTTKSVEYLFQ